MAALFNLCKRQIEKDKKNGTHNVTQGALDAFLLQGRLTPEEYNELCELLNEANKDVEVEE